MFNFLVIYFLIPFVEGLGDRIKYNLFIWYILCDWTDSPNNMFGKCNILLFKFIITPQYLTISNILKNKVTLHKQGFKKILKTQQGYIAIRKKMFSWVLDK